MTRMTDDHVERLPGLIPPLEQEHEPDPPEFDRSKVPTGPLADLFFDGRTGRGLTDPEWDEQDDRLKRLDPEFWARLHGREPQGE